MGRRRRSRSRSRGTEWGRRKWKKKKNRKKKSKKEEKKEKEKKKSFAGDFATINYTFCNVTFNDTLLHWKHQKRNIQKKVLISEACLQGPHGILSRLTLHGSLKVEDLNPIPYPIDVTVYSMAAARDIGKAPYLRAIQPPTMAAGRLGWWRTRVSARVTWLPRPLLWWAPTHCTIPTDPRRHGGRTHFHEEAHRLRQHWGCPYRGRRHRQDAWKLWEEVQRI